MSLSTRTFAFCSFVPAHFQEINSPHRLLGVCPSSLLCRTGTFIAVLVFLRPFLLISIRLEEQHSVSVFFPRLDFFSLHSTSEAVRWVGGGALREQHAACHERAFPTKIDTRKNEGNRGRACAEQSRLNGSDGDGSMETYFASTAQKEKHLHHFSSE